MTTFEDVAAAGHIRLTTFRADGTPAGTPVWTAPDRDQDGVLYTVTSAGSGKVKRIRANAQVTVAPSDWQGQPEGEALDGTGRVVEADEDPDLIARADAALTRKYEGQTPGIELLRGLQQRPWVVLELTLLPA
jgi:PPOX class probable F420-dependent enzyme